MHLEKDEDNLQISNKIINKEINDIQIKKGKHAHSTQYRRILWEEIIWPLILEIERPYFTIDDFKVKRKMFSETHNIPSSKLSGGLISLVIKGILIKEKKFYSLHYRLIPYFRKKVELSYGEALKEIHSK